MNIEVQNLLDAIEGRTAREVSKSISELIDQGHLKPNQVLPSVRALAGALEVSPNTVASAYSRLREEGKVHADGRRGTRVSKQVTSIQMSPQQRQGGVDLATGNLDSELLPPLENIVSKLELVQTGYDIAYDFAPLLTRFGQWADENRVSNKYTAVFNGALDVIERALKEGSKSGERVLVEDPGWPPVISLVKKLGLVHVPLELDVSGAIVPGNELLESVSAVIVTPRAQNPTGVSMTQERLNSWKEAVNNHKALKFIIDDYWGPISNVELEFSGITNSNTVYVLSLSKFLSPDIRVALACGNKEFLGRMLAMQQIGPRWVSSFSQQLAFLLWEYVDDNKYLDVIRNGYTRKREALNKVFSEEKEELDTVVYGEGLHVWIPVSSESTTTSYLAYKGWLVAPGQQFSVRPTSAIRISLGNVGEEEINALAKQVAAAMVGSIEIFN